MNLNFLNENRFTTQPMNKNPQEEIMATDWEKIITNHKGADWELLKEICIELWFPVKEGQSKNEEFITALKRGLFPNDYNSTPHNNFPWTPYDPIGIKVYLHRSSTGRLPVIECESDDDFIRLHRSLACRFEPTPVPDSRGATIIKNYNNWLRVNMHRENGEIPKDNTLYRDYIILLSHRYYSGIAPEVFNLSDAEWREKSLIIRREHETAHYMTQRYYHSTKNEIHDEIIADFMGLTAAFGDYDPQKFLTFLGLEKVGEYRKGGRLEIYLADAPLLGHDFDLLCDTIRKACHNIKKYYDCVSHDRVKTFHTLCHTSVADMAKGDFASNTDIPNIQEKNENNYFGYFTAKNTQNKNELFETTYKDHFSYIYNYIYSRVFNYAIAEDLTADVFVNAYKSWDTFNSERGTIKSWLGGIAVNIMKSYYEKNTKHKKIIELNHFQDASPEIELEITYDEKIHKILSLIKELPEEKQEIISMKYFLKLTNREIAAKTGMSESNVGTILHRTLKEIKINL